MACVRIGESLSSCMADYISHLQRWGGNLTKVHVGVYTLVNNICGGTVKEEFCICMHINSV